MQSEKLVSLIQMEKIVPNPYQPRKVFEPEGLQELAASITEHGILQPITVRRVGGLFELVSGERRLRAARLAGLQEVPALVAQMDDAQSAVLALIENIQRQDLSYMEEAEAYQRLVSEYHMTQEEIARAMGKTQPSIANKLRILRLSAGVKQVLAEYGLTERHARALLRLPQGEWQVDAVLHMARHGLNVRESEAYVEKLLAQNEALHHELGVQTAERPLGRKGEEPLGRGKQSELEKAGLEQKSKAKTQRIRHFIHDIHLFTNTVKKAARYMSDAGVPVEVEENKNEGYYEMVIRVPYQ